MKQLSRKASTIAPSATLAVNELAKTMRANNLDVVGFGVGEPDFPTPDYINQAYIRALADGQTKYAPAAGMMELRKSVCNYLKNKLEVSYSPANIVVSSGAKHSIYLALAAILNEGDEVILPGPYWVSYYESIRMNGGIPVIVSTDESTRFKMTADMLRTAVTEKTKAVILNNPSNPTGMLYSRSELEELAAVIVEKDLYVIADEIYCALVYNDTFTSMASLGAEVKERTILINGVSKTYAMTGWRVGFAAASQLIVDAMVSYQSHSTGSPGTMNQLAAAEAYTNGEADVRRMIEAFDERRRYFVDRVAKMPLVSCLEPDGAFYIFMNVKACFGKRFYGEVIEDSDQFTQSLLKNALVAVVPGTAFGADGYIRWSYAASLENIRKGLDRLEAFLAHAED